MVALWVAVFFAVVSAVAWLALFPAARDAAAAGVGRLRSRVESIASRWQTRAAGRASSSSQVMRAGGARLRGQLSRHRYLLGASLALLVLPPLLIMQTRQRVALDGFEVGATAPVDSQIQALLRGERLAPPPELPPAVFLAAEAELLRSPTDATATATTAPEAISSADRRWRRIAPDFQQRVLAIYQVMREQYGYQMVLVEGYRSPQRQAALARKSGNVTNAGPGQSCHQYGLAVDSALYRDGKLQWDMSDPWTKRGYFLYGELAARAGLEWGGNWRSIKDYVHLEMKAECRQARRAAGY